MNYGIQWKQSLIPPKSPLRIENKSHDNKIEEEIKFDVNLYYSKLKLLIFQHQFDLLYEIEEQIQPFNYIELFGVLNSQLSNFVFNQIENFSPQTPSKFIISCLRLCSFFTAIDLNIDSEKYKRNRDKITALTMNTLEEIQKRYQDFITHKFIDSLKEMLNIEELLTHSLLVISNIFYQTEEIYEYINIFEILDQLLNIENDQILSICSLILKRFLKYDKENYPIQIIDKLIEYSTALLSSKSVFAQMKTLQMISKLILKYWDQIISIKNVNFIEFIKNIIIEFVNSTEILIFGNILHLILSIMNVNKSSDFLTSFMIEIEICNIIRIGLNSNFVFIQSASADIFSFFISLPSSQTFNVLIDSNLTEFIIQSINNSNFKEKEKIRNAFFSLFWREDLNFDDIFNNQGVLFLVESITMWPKEIIPILNMLIIKYPQLVSYLEEMNIINELDELIFEDQEIDENGKISARALKADILKIVSPKEQI